MLVYDVDPSGWSDELTALHEDATLSGAHLIDVASRRRAIQELKRAVGARAGTNILEVGCSAGHLLADLMKELPHAAITGGDYTIGTLSELGEKIPDIPLIRFDLSRSPLASESYDAIVLLNVLEHIKEDRAAVGHVARMLKPGGVAVIEVPAGPELFDDFEGSVTEVLQLLGIPHPW